MRRAALLAVFFSSFLCLMVSVVGANTDAVTQPDQAVLRKMDNPGNNDYWEIPTQNATPHPDEPSFTENEAYAAGLEIGGGYFKTVEPTPPKKKTPTSEPDDDTTQDNDGNTNQGNGSSDTHITYHLGGLGEKISKGVLDSFGEMVSDLVNTQIAKFNEATETLVSTLFYGDNQLVREPQKTIWLGMMGVATILIPLTLSFVAAQGLKNGASSITGYAMAREALFEWAIAIAAAASSFFIMSKSNELCSALMKAINWSLVKKINTSSGVSATTHILNKLIDITIPNVNAPTNPDIGNIVLSIFAYAVAFAFMAAFAYAMIARQAILMFSFGSAPLVILLGTIPMLRWIRGLWLKVTAIAFLLGPLNALMIGISAILIDSLDSIRTGLVADVSNMIIYLIMIGIISVLIGINTLVGKSVYGSVMEIAKGTIGVITAGVGLVTGHAGKLAGLKAVRDAKKISIGSGGSGIVGPEKTAQTQASITKQKGQSLARSSLRTMSKYGVGLQQGALQAEQELLSQSIKAGFPPETASTSNPVATARHKENRTSGLAGQNQAMMGMTEADAHQRIDSADGAFNSMLGAMHTKGLYHNHALAALNMDETAFQQYSLDKFAFSNNVRVDTPNSELIRSDLGQTVFSGIEIASAMGTPDNMSKEWTQGRWEMLYDAINERRRVGDSFHTIRTEATKVDNIADWISSVLEGK